MSYSYSKFSLAVFKMKNFIFYIQIKKKLLVKKEGCVFFSPCTEIYFVDMDLSLCPSNSFFFFLGN